MGEELLRKEREFLIPGEKIVESMNYLPGKNCFREGNSIYAKRIGLLSVTNRVVSIIPLNSVYMPKVGDMVIAEVEDIQSNGWILDIKSPSYAYLPLSGIREFIDTSKTDLSKVYDIGDALYVKIVSANSSGSIHVAMTDSRCRKFTGGIIISINPAKVPRLIGRQGSMINLIKEKTKCKISVGQNGIIWLQGEYEDIAVQAIKLVEEEAVVEGLTDKIAAFLTKKSIEGKSKGKSAAKPERGR